MLSLGHQHQPQPYGCIYHAAYALLGDPTLLDHIEDDRTAAWVARLARRGVVPYHLWYTRLSSRTEPVITDRDWEAIRSQAQVQQADTLPLMVTIASNRVQGYHLTAVLIPSRRMGDVVQISDSALPELLHLSWQDFLRSRWAAAYEVEMLVSLDADTHPCEPARPTPREQVSV